MPRKKGAGRRYRIARLRRAIRFSAAAAICWGALLGGAAVIIIINNENAAAARASLPAPGVGLTPQERNSWSHFPRFQGVVPVLAYHGVDSKVNPLTVSRNQFAEQLLALHLGGFHTVTIDQYERYVRTGSTAGLPPNPILLTFDDGELTAYRGANDTLAKYGDTAVMFVVASWPDAHSQWALHWNELVRMQQSGIWDIQEHAGSGHTHIPVTPNGQTGEYYGFRMWTDGHLESFAAYKQRASHDVLTGERTLREHIPGYRPVAFAVPYSNYGQRFTNDPHIPGYFLRFMHTQFPVIFDGDYLDEGVDRPAEIKGRWSPRLSYRITQGNVLTLPDLYCRLRSFALRLPLWREYGCLRSPGSNVPSVRSD